MIRGGIAILDEGNRMSEKSWASLAPLLDNRRYVESIVAGIKIKAHAQFRLVTTMNDDASTFELPEYIHSRLQPQILIDFPERDEEYQILKENLPFAEDRILHLCDRFSAAGARRRRALYGARRHQHRTLRHQAEEPGHGARARNAGARNGHARNPGRGSAAVCQAKSTCLICRIPVVLRRGRFTYLPVVPGRLEFAIEVRRRSSATSRRSSPWNFPPPSKTQYLRAMRRLPEISVIFYPDEASDAQTAGAVYVPVEPADPFVEAIRTRSGNRRRIVFADPDSGERPHLPDAYPDTYSIRAYRARKIR